MTSSTPPPSPPNPKLHELDPTARFSNRADDYAKYRPSYPAAAIDAVVATVATVDDPTCADIGAGTGISSRLIADRGVRVIAIEPNEAMRAAAEAHPRVQWRDGSAESTGLADQSVDLVVCAQAFHWFNADNALSELRRILKPRGVLCLMWNDRDNADALTAEYGRLILEASDNHPAARDRSECGEVIFKSRLFQHAKLEVFQYEQPMTTEGLVGRALSASYVPKQDKLHENLVSGLQRAFEAAKAADGLVKMQYRTRVYTAVRAG